MANWIARVLDRTLNDNYVQVLEKSRTTYALNLLPDRPTEASLVKCIPDDFDMSLLRHHKDGMIVTPHGILACNYTEKGESTPRTDIYFHRAAGGEYPPNQRKIVTNVERHRFAYLKGSEESAYMDYIKRLGMTVNPLFIFHDVTEEPYRVAYLEFNRKRLSNIGKNRLLCFLTGRENEEIVLYKDGNDLLDIITKQGGNTGTVRSFGFNADEFMFSKDWYEYEINNSNSIHMNMAAGMMLESDIYPIFKGDRWPDDVKRPPYTDFALEYFKTEISQKMTELGITHNEDRWKYFFTEEETNDGRLIYRLIPDRIPMKTRAEWEAWEEEKNKSKKPFIYIGLQIPVVTEHTKIKPAVLRDIHIPLLPLNSTYAKRSNEIKYFPCLPYQLTDACPVQYRFDDSDGYMNLHTLKHTISPKKLAGLYRGTAFTNDQYGVSAWFMNECTSMSREIRDVINEIYHVAGYEGELNTNDGLSWYIERGKPLLDLSQLTVVYCQTQEEYDAYFNNITNPNDTMNVLKKFDTDNGSSGFNTEVFNIGDSILNALSHKNTSIVIRLTRGYIKNNQFTSLPVGGFSEIILKASPDGEFLIPHPDIYGVNSKLKNTTWLSRYNILMASLKTRTGSGKFAIQTDTGPRLRFALNEPWFENTVSRSFLVRNTGAFFTGVPMLIGNETDNEGRTQAFRELIYIRFDNDDIIRDKVNATREGFPVAVSASGNMIPMMRDNLVTNTSWDGRTLSTWYPWKITDTKDFTAASREASCRPREHAYQQSPYSSRVELANRFIARELTDSQPDHQITRTMTNDQFIAGIVPYNRQGVAARSQITAAQYNEFRKILRDYYRVEPGILSGTDNFIHHHTENNRSYALLFYAAMMAEHVNSDAARYKDGLKHAYMSAGMITDINTPLEKYFLPDHLRLYVRHYFNQGSKTGDNIINARDVSTSNEVNTDLTSSTGIFQELAATYNSTSYADCFYHYAQWLLWAFENRVISLPKSKYAIDWTKFKVKNPLFIAELESPNVNSVCNYSVQESVRRVMTKGVNPGTWIFSNMSYDMVNEDWTTNGIRSTNIPSYYSGAAPAAEASFYCTAAIGVFHRNDAAKVLLWMNNLDLAKNNVLDGGEIIHAQYFAHYCAPMLTNSNSEYYLFPYVADFFPVNPPKEVVDEFFMNHVYNNGIESFYKRYPSTMDGTRNMIDFLRGLKDKAYQIVMKHYEDVRIGTLSLHDLMKQRVYSGYNHLTFWYTALDYVHFDMIVNRVINYVKKIEKPFIQLAWMDNMKEVFIPDADDPNNTKLVEKITGNQLIGYFWLAIESIEHACSPYSDKNLTAAQRSIAHRKITRVADHPATIPLTTSNPYITSRQHLYRVMPRLFLRAVYEENNAIKDGRLFFSYETSAFYSCDSWDGMADSMNDKTFSSWLLNNYDRSLRKRSGTTESRVHHYFGNSNNHVRIGVVTDAERNRIQDNYLSYDNKLFRFGSNVVNGTRYRTPEYLPVGYSADYNAPKRPTYPSQDYTYVQDTPSQTYSRLDYARYDRDRVTLGLIFDPKTTIFGIVSDQTMMNEFIDDLAEVSPLSYLKHLGLKPKNQMDERTYRWIQERIHGVSAVIGDRYPRFLSPAMYRYYYDAMKTMVINIPSNQLTVVQRFINGLRDIRHYRVLMFLLSILPYHQIDNPEFLMTAIDETVDLDKLDSSVFFEDSFMFDHVNRAIKYLRAHFNGGGEDNIIRNESLIEIVRGNNIVRFDRTVFRKGGSSNISKDAVTRDRVKATNVRGIRLFSPRVTNENEITKLIITTFPTNSVVKEMRVGNVNFGLIRMRDKLSHSSWYIVVSDRPSTLIAPSGIRASNSKLVSIMKIGGSPTLTDSYALQGTWLRYDQTSITLRQFHDDYVINPSFDNIPDNILPENAVAYYAVSPAGKYLDFPNGHEYQTIIEEDGKPVIARFRTLDDGPTDVANCFIIVAVNE